MQALFLTAKVSVCLSVCPSHACIVTKRTKVRPRFLYHMKGKFMHCFGHIEWLVAYAPFYLKFWVEWAHPASKTAIFTRYLLVAAQPLELAKKSPILTNRSSVTAFH